MTGTEWVVTYWPVGGTRQERRFGETEEKQAMSFALRLPPNAKLFVDHVDFGETPVVR